MASNGHVRDLPKSSLGIDVDGDFEPKYIITAKAGEILAKFVRRLRRPIRYIRKLILTVRRSHLMASASPLKLEGKDVKCISFNEITKNAVKDH